MSENIFNITMALTKEGNIESTQSFTEVESTITVDDVSHIIGKRKPYVVVQSVERRFSKQLYKFLKQQLSIQQMLAKPAADFMEKNKELERFTEFEETLKGFMKNPKGRKLQELNHLAGIIAQIPSNKRQVATYQQSVDKIQEQISWIEKNCPEVLN